MPIIPKGIKTRGNKIPNSIPIISETPALITIKGIAAKNNKINLVFLFIPIFQPKISSMNPINPIIKIEVIKAKIWTNSPVE